MNKKPRLGIIGLGNVVSKYHLPAIQLNNDFEVIAGCDLDLQKRDVLGDIFFTTKLEEMIKHRDIDIYVVATTPSSHFAITKRLLEAGKTVLLEKPATEIREQFEELLKTSTDQLHFAFHFASSADTRGFRAWMKKNNLRIDEFRVHLNDPHTDKNFVIDEAGISLGGTYMDLAANALSVLYALGVRNLKMINRYQIFSPNSPDIDFHAYCELVGNQVSGTITLDWSAGLNCKGLEVKCSDGKWYILNNSTQSAMSHDGEIIIPPCEGNRLINHYVGVYTDLFDDIKNGTCNRKMATEVNNTFFQFYDLPNGPGYCPR